MDVARIGVSSLASSSGNAAMPSSRLETGLSSLGAEGETGKAEQKLDVEEAVERIRTQVQTLQRNLNFSVDDSTGEVVVQVLDGDSGKVVRQIPSEDILRLADRLDEMRSLLFEATA